VKSLLITPSLLDSWDWYLQNESDNARDEFTGVMKRERSPDNDAMMQGRAFESRVRIACDPLHTEWLTDNDKYDLDQTSRKEEDEEYTACVSELAHFLKGGVWQIALSKTETIGGISFVKYGRVDVINYGIIDVKYSQTFNSGKYLGKAQTKMYLNLAPQAPWMQYTVCDGKVIYYGDKFMRGDVEPIDNEIRNFWNWLQNDKELLNLYTENWQSKY
jgi:hypothetical protein